MTPYELSYKIFQEARTILQSKFYGEVEAVQLYLSATDRGMWNNNPINMNPTYPTIEEIEVLADRIKQFVEKTT